MNHPFFLKVPRNIYAITTCFLDCRKGNFKSLLFLFQTMPPPVHTYIVLSIAQFQVHPLQRAEKVMAPHSSTLAWKIPWIQEPGGLQSMGSRKVRHDWATSLSLFTFMHWRRKWQPTPVFLPGESQGRGAWWASVYGVAQSRTRLKRLSSSSSSPTQPGLRTVVVLTPCTNIIYLWCGWIIHWIINLMYLVLGKKMALLFVFMP